MRLSINRCIRAFTDVPQQSLICLDFKDGSEGLFPYVWLRDCSLDPKTYTITKAMKGRLHFMREFDVKVRPKEVHLDRDENCLFVQWPDGVLSRYEQSWLKRRCPGSAAVRERRRQVYLGRECVRLWDKEAIEGRLKRFSHSEFLTDEKVLHDFLTAVCVDGIAVLEGAEPLQKCPNVMEKIVSRIGFLQRNHFGEIFEVAPKPAASNMAYASANELPYHTDFPSLEQPPELQMLHMARQAPCGGGLSMFVDGFHVAEEMARHHPEQFRLLASVPLEFIEEGYDVHTLQNGREENFHYDMMARHTTIKLDQQDRVVRVQFGNVMRSWFVDVSDPMLVQQTYEALKLFTELCYAPHNQLIFPLKTGATVLWANTRLLHARSAYRVLGEPQRERHVLGCYFAWDTVKSRVRLLRERLQLAENEEAL